MNDGRMTMVGLVDFLQDEMARKPGISTYTVKVGKEYPTTGYTINDDKQEFRMATRKSLPKDNLRDAVEDILDRGQNNSDGRFSIEHDDVDRLREIIHYGRKP